MSNIYFDWTASGSRFVNFDVPTGDDFNAVFDLITTGFDGVAAGVDVSQASGTSTTSLVVGTGSKSLIIQTGRAFFAGQSVSIAYTTDPTTKMLGTVASYDSTTGAMVVTVETSVGSGTYALWTVALNILSGATLGANTFTGEQNWAKGADVASATTTNLSAATGNLVHVTGTTTITAITLGSGYWRCVIFDGALTLTHGASLVLPGAANITTAAGDRALFVGDGTAVRCISYVKASGQAVAGVGDHSVTVTTGNGHGSTNTVIRRFTTTESSTGTAITYADSAGNGASFTINEAGMYEVYYIDARAAGNANYGISLNSAQLTTSVLSITASTRKGLVTAISVGENMPITRILRLAAGDVIRPHTNGDVDASTAASSVFSIRKIAL